VVPGDPVGQQRGVEGAADLHVRTAVRPDVEHVDRGAAQLDRPTDRDVVHHAAVDVAAAVDRHRRVHGRQRRGRQHGRQQLPQQQQQQQQHRQQQHRQQLIFNFEDDVHCLTYFLRLFFPLTSSTF